MKKLMILMCLLFALPAWAASVKDFGADPTGKTDSTAAIQRAITAEPQGGTLTFPAGVYLVKSLTLHMGLTLRGAGAATTKLLRLPMQGNTRMVQQIYSASNSPTHGDSLPVVIEGINFDGNSEEQGDYSGFKLQQAAALTFTSDWHAPGRLLVTVQDCRFQNTCGDGLQFVGNVNLKVLRCSGYNSYRGVLQGGGYNGIVSVDTLTMTKGPQNEAGWHIEDAVGLTMIGKNIRCENTRFDISATGGSQFDFKSSIITGPQPKFFLPDSSAKFQYTKFNSSGSGWIQFPKYLYFDNCTFTAIKKARAGIAKVSAAPQVIFKTSFAGTQNGYVGFSQCLWMTDGSFAASDTVYGIWVAFDDPKAGNKTKLYLGRVYKSCNGGIKAEPGSTILINGTIIEAGK
jgi:hypothetical protein